MAESKHKPGEMDITDQEKTFDGFVRWSIRIAILSICVVIFLAVVAA